MATEFKSGKQKELFEEIAKAGELVFACGPKGISANIVGEFSVKHYPSKKEHRLEMGDGGQHVHIDWDRVKKVEYGIFHGEGMLTFSDDSMPLFKLYRMEGEFSDTIQKIAGELI